MFGQSFWLFLIASSVSLGVSHGIECMFFGFPELEYDGKDRVESLTEKNFNKSVHDADEENEIVFFSDVEADDSELDNYECFLQLSAQVMERRDYRFFTVNTTKETKIRAQELDDDEDGDGDIDVDKDEDTIHVYKDGYVIEYHGARDPDVFIGWLLNIPDEPLTIINDEDDVDEWEDIEDTHTRVIGYFLPGSDDLQDFEDAAEDFMGEVEFFAVVSKHWARRMGLTELGSVEMYRPYESDPLEGPDDLDTEEEFEDWVAENKDPVMMKLSLLNYFNVWKDTTDSDEKMIVAFVDEEEDDGEAVEDLLEKIARRNSHHADKLDIVFVDYDEFPLMVNVWEEMFGIEIEDGPVIGYVDISEREGIWFDMDQLNLGEADEHFGANLDVLQRWIDQILNETISLDDDDEDDDDEDLKQSGRRMFRKGQTQEASLKNDSRAANKPKSNDEQSNGDLDRFSYDSNKLRKKTGKTKKIKVKDRRRQQQQQQDQHAQHNQLSDGVDIHIPSDRFGLPSNILDLEHLQSGSEYGASAPDICEYDFELRHRISILERQVERLQMALWQRDSTSPDDVTTQKPASMSPGKHPKPKMKRLKTLAKHDDNVVHDLILTEQNNHSIDTKQKGEVDSSSLTPEQASENIVKKSSSVDNAKQFSSYQKQRFLRIVHHQSFAVLQMQYEQTPANEPQSDGEVQSMSVKLHFMHPISMESATTKTPQGFLGNQTDKLMPTCAAVRPFDKRNLLPESPQPTNTDYIAASRIYKRRPLSSYREACYMWEHFTGTNAIVIYFVCTVIVGMARAMQITMSCYIRPVLDDWRDYLRQRLPTYILAHVGI